jgi:hypothetical protein
LDSLQRGVSGGEHALAPGQEARIVQQDLQLGSIDRIIAQRLDPKRGY